MFPLHAMFFFPGKDIDEGHREWIFTECLLCAWYCVRPYRDAVFLISQSSQAGEGTKDTQRCSWIVQRSHSEKVVELWFKLKAVIFSLHFLVKWVISFHELVPGCWTLWSDGGMEGEDQSWQVGVMKDSLPSLPSRSDVWPHNRTDGTIEHIDFWGHFAILKIFLLKRVLKRVLLSPKDINF